MDIEKKIYTNHIHMPEKQVAFRTKDGERVEFVSWEPAKKSKKSVARVMNSIADKAPAWREQTAKMMLRAAKPKGKREKDLKNVLAKIEKEKAKR